MLLSASSVLEKAERLELASTLVEDYENKYRKIDATDPSESVKRGQELGLTRKDMEKSIGSLGRVSEVLNGQRYLNISKDKKLNKNLNIPTEILIPDFKKNRLIITNGLFLKLVLSRICDKPLFSSNHWCKTQV